jgi:sugar transferase (PEP-CTERM system associated)
VKLLGHDVPKTIPLLAALDGLLIFGVLRLLGWELSCLNCAPGPIVDLNLPQQLLVTAIFLVLTMSVGLYNDDAIQHVVAYLKRFLLAWNIFLVPAVVLLVVARAGAPLAGGWSMGVLILTIAGLMLLMLSVHMVLVWRLRLGFLKKRIVVLGDGAEADAIAKFTAGPGGSRLQHVQTLRDWGPGRFAPATVGNLRLKSPEPDLTPLFTIVERLKANEIVVAVEDRRDVPVTELLECKLKGIVVVDALTFWEREAAQIDASRAGADWLAFSDGFASDQRHRALKRLADIAISSLFLILVAPLCLLTALAIKLDSPGPIFYRQERVGLNGVLFRLWKFRSMRVDAERNGVPRWAATSDDRVTRVGRFIRLVRIDEIPQIINVLSGEMSFIGPRPERPFFVEQLKQQIPHYDLRHRIRPGITGWAQINYPYGASVEDARRKLSYDLYYLKKNDLVLDLAILIQTVRVILLPEGAR